MKVIEINGGKALEGSIKISGAKNATVALIPATILAIKNISTLCNVPDITDTDNLVNILEYLGCKVTRNTETMTIDATNVENKEISYEFSSKLRASYYFMGVLLARFKKVKMSFPGGCNIGKRPIDLHLKAFESMGATVKYDNSNFFIEAEELKGAEIYLDIASVGATINIMLAAALAKGTTIIHNAAKEPEIINVATFINNMGGKITGAGTGTIKIEGVEELEGCFDEIIPDRIEAGTYLMLGALTSKRLKVYNIIPEHLSSLVSKLQEMKVKLDMGDDYITIYESNNLKPINVQTLIYPGFATDLQQPLSTLLTKADGVSSIEETIWENRFMHVKELNKMGAKISVVDNKAYITGPTFLKGTEVVATDLRGGAAVLLAGLAAVGKTRILNAEHILRGYEGIEIIDE
ncbi:MAG: UDP-N-acetylglucosamine 1-carboxyvinyltransferase [Clostridiales bacterium]|nr:UDP-N-acetylglucosamine 1-carboxyvinyltransferase [Clostridiales bacterium]